MELLNFGSDEVRRLRVEFDNNNPGNARITGMVMEKHAARLTETLPTQAHAGLENGPEMQLTLSFRGVFLIGASDFPVQEGQTPFCEFGLGAIEAHIAMGEASESEDGSDPSDTPDTRNAAQYTALNDENTKLKSDLQTATVDRNRLDELEAKVRELQDENSRLANQNTELNQQLEEATKPPENKDSKDGPAPHSEPGVNGGNPS